MKIEQAASDSGVSPTTVRWEDISMRRIAMALVAAPLMPVALFGLLRAILPPEPGEAVDPRDQAISIAALAVVAVLWSLLTGSLHLGFLSRRIGHISRKQCRWLGMISAASLGPCIIIAMFVFSALSGHPASDRDMTIGFPVAMFSAFLATPFGFLGGLLFWKLGVKQRI
jgi:hypothetical protein